VQVSCPVLPGDTAESLARKVQQLEFEQLPKAIERFL
jgi:folate-dependent phosphoribosylglycinamide formyltransferase PurN